MQTERYSTSWGRGGSKLGKEKKENERERDRAEMAVSMACFSSQCFSLASHFNKLSLSSSSSANSRNLHLKSVTSSLSVSQSLFSQGCLSLSTLGRRTSSRIVCDATPPKEADSAAKRARQAKTRRLRNKSRKSEMKTRMKKVFCC